MKKKYIRSIIICVLVLLAAVTAIFHIEIEPAEQPVPAPPASSPAVETKNRQAESVKDEKEEKQKNEAGEEKNTEIDKEPAKEEAVAETLAEEGSFLREANPPEQKAVISPNDETPSPKSEEHFCTLEIRCDTAADTSKLENQAAAPYVPESGVILKASEFEFTPGESVFDILLRATKERSIHMEFRDDNTYSGKYIEGINYLYEMDAGPLSGWMYKVNGRFPNYGCAAYEVKDGDVIVWMYTCDLGVDVGDNSTW